MSSYGRYGLTTAAFSPDAGQDFYVESEAHRRALAHLRHGLKQGEGIVILTGDTGCGKTTVLNRIAAETDGEAIQALVFDAATIDHQNLERALQEALGEGDRPSDVGLTDVLLERRDEGTRYAIMFDNAEAFDNDGLEAIRRLSVMYHDGDALLQIALAGDTPMRSILYKANMDRFRQRVIASYHIPALSDEQVEAYVGARVTAAGGHPDKVFSVAAISALAKHGAGNPGKINQLAATAMDLAAARDNDHVAGKDVNAAANGAEPVPMQAAVADRAAPTQPVAADDASSDGAELLTEPVAEAPKPLPKIVAANPVERINGQRLTPVLKPNTPLVTANELSPDDINDAIERIGATGTAGAAPAPTNRRPMSPQEMMRARPSTPLVPVTPPNEDEVAEEEETPAKSEAPVRLPPVPEPSSDLWDPAHSMAEDHAARLDRVEFRRLDSDRPAAQEVDTFLADAREKLDSLRSTLKALRDETERLDTHRQEAREKIRGRIDNLRERLDDLAQER